MRQLAPLLVGSALAFIASAKAPDSTGEPLWDFYRTTLVHAKYIDLTHAIAPGGPIGEVSIAPEPCRGIAELRPARARILSRQRSRAPCG